MIREACLRVLVLCTIFLKEAAAFGLCLSEIGEMMSREFSGMEEEPSELELICLEARKFVEEREVFSQTSDLEEEDAFQFHMEYNEEDQHMAYNPPQSFGCGLGGGCSRNPLSMLEESIEEEDSDEENKKITTTESSDFLRDQEVFRYPTNLSASLKSIILTEKAQRNWVGTYNENAKTTSTVGANGPIQGRNSRSAEEKLPSSTSFVKLSDMDEEQWAAFLEHFQELLPNAFRRRKSLSSGQKQKQRLGTSCQF